MKTNSVKSFLYLLIVVFFLNNILFAQTKTSLPYISVKGNKFVNDQGNIVIFRGLSVADPDRLAKAGKWNNDLFKELKDWNINIVRFPVHPSAWRERGEDNYLKLLDDGIKWAGDLGIYVIIDWHAIGNLRTELFLHPSYNTTKTETFRFWKTIADRYKYNSTAAFYELFNEPTTFNGKFGKITWQQHKELMEEIIGIIYAYDTTVIPLVAGFNWAYDLTNVRYEPVEFPNVAYVTHPYPQKREKPWEEKWETDWGFVADRYPVIATEFGFMKATDQGAHIPTIGDEEYGDTIINYFNKKGISWVVWVFDPNWVPKMIKNWKYEPTLQGMFFKKKFKELNSHK